MAVWALVGVAAAQEPLAPPEAATPPSASVEPLAADALVQELVKQVRESVAVIRVRGRDGRQQGLGTAFVVGADGLLGTNLHVIGEGRPIEVQLADGSVHPVQEIYASDRALDLALVRIERHGLKPLVLGDSDAVQQGQFLLAVGNPQGLVHSVVAGVLSGQREIDGQQMLQLAMPIEPGNSGGPVVDRQARVLGIITRKSAVTANLGFAMPINALKRLLERPNPVSIESWLAIGALDARRWTTLFGGSWRQRAGRIECQGPGDGFGGRTLCLWVGEPPEMPFELMVSVRLEHESGAAGLVFASDGGDRHWGFYPSAGNLRLSRFDGPDVSSWQVVRQVPSPYYRAGEWNTLRVRVEREGVRCYVNEHLVIEVRGLEISGGRVGLAKFREPGVQFKQFRVGPELGGGEPDPALVEAVTAAAQAEPQTGADATRVAELATGGPAAVRLLEEEAQALVQRAERLRELAAAVHQHAVTTELQEMFAGDEERVDLFAAALLVARLDQPDLDAAAYQEEMDRLAEALRASLPPDASEADRFAALNEFFFRKQGFHGSRTDYYNRANSYVSAVLDDREGLPITLSLVYLELARRIGLTMAGIGLPGHFVVQYQPAEGQPQLIDVFNGGQPLTQEEAGRLVLATSGRQLAPEYLRPISKRAMVARMLRNLFGLVNQRDPMAMHRYLDALLAVDPESVEDRLRRAALRFETGRLPAALEDIDWILEREPPGVNVEELARFRQLVQQQLDSQQAQP
jgi:regulator of sirC expression with transglutaminase-like and TPR domain